MAIFVTGTGTDVGKTLICSWLCLHTGFDYFKPIQTGETSDSERVATLSGAKIHPCTYRYPSPVSPHLAAQRANSILDVSQIKLPKPSHLIIEGAGGLLVPLNRDFLMIDLIEQLNVPTILVAHSGLGTINHTLLSLQALKARQLPVVGVILSGEVNQPNCEAIEYYGQVKVLAQIPFLPHINRNALLNIPLGEWAHEFK